MSSKTPRRTTTELAPAIPQWLEVVREKVESLKFGSVQIVVHEGRITQVESIEKTRFQAKPGESKA